MARTTKKAIDSVEETKQPESTSETKPKRTTTRKKASPTTESTSQEKSQETTAASAAPATGITPTPQTPQPAEAVPQPTTSRPAAGQRPVAQMRAPQQMETINGRRVWRSPMQNQRRQGANFAGVVDGRMIPDAGVPTEEFTGILDINRDGNGILRSNYSTSERDAYISGTQIRRFKLRPGDEITGPARRPKENEQYWGLLKVDKVNGQPPEKQVNRVKFNNLTPVYPDKKLVLETEAEILSTRLIDLVAPIGHGQRGMIVSPPKAGKTTVIKEISTGIAKNYPDIHMMAVLIGERPEEVTDIRRHIAAVTNNKGEVAASNFDEPAQEQVRVSELALERARRLVEQGQHVVVLLDSITRLARAYNLAMPTSGRTLSGGFDPAALYPPKKFFGAARNFETFQTPEGEKTGSLTILGTALIDTGSRMDDLIYEEFKGTGNMELVLDRQLAERRIFPAIDVQRSGTRREDLLFDQMDYQNVILMRRMIDMLDPKERTVVLVQRMKGTKSNKEFLASLKEG